MSDRAYEYADSQCDVYYHKAYNSAGLFSEYTDEAIQNFGIDGILLKDEINPLYRLIVIGQYEFYSQLARFVLDQLQEFVENSENIETESNENSSKEKALV